jgi:hypothetical protein
VRDVKFIAKGNTLLTVSNDGLLKEWELDGRSIDPIRETIVTNTYLYALEILNPDTKKCAMAGDRGFVFVVERGKLTDVFPFAEPVWSLARLPDGDLAVGCASGVLAVLTEDRARRAAPEVEAAHFDSLIAKRISTECYKSASVATLPQFGSAANRKLGHPVLMRRGDDKALALWVPGCARWVQYGTLGSPRVADAAGTEWDAKIEIAVEDRKLPLFFNCGESGWLVARRFIQAWRLPAGKTVPLLLLLKANVGEMIGAPAALDPAFGEPEDASAGAFQESEASIMENCESDPDAVVALCRGRLRRGDRCGNGHLRVLRKLALGRALPADFVREFAAAMARNGELRDGNCDAILWVADGFKHYPEEVLDVMEKEKVIEGEKEVLGCLAAEAQQAFVRLLLNCACFSLDVPARLAEIAETLSVLSLKSLEEIDCGDFIKTCHVCVGYSPEATEKLKLQVETIRKLSPRTDSIQSLLIDLDTKLCQ